MLQRLMMIGLLIISVVAVLGTEANAGCSCIKIVGGSCYTCCNGSCFWAPKGLLCNLSGIAPGSGGDKDITCGGEGVCPGLSDITGNCVDNPATLPVEDTRDTLTGLVSCQNNGGNFAVGNNPESFSLTLDGISNLGSSLDKKGKFRGKNVIASAEREDLAPLDVLCQPSGGGQTWKAFDVAFCGSKSFEVVTSVELSDSTIDGQLRAVCTGSCANIAFDSTTGTFGGLPYACYACPLTADGLHWNCAACTQAGLGGPTNCPLL
jgi:hypothetical protein